MPSPPPPPGGLLAAASRLQPDKSEAFFRTAWTFTDPADMDKFLEGIRKAGVLETGNARDGQDG